MNWTGGSLQRHSKANANTVVKKQKQHFAKARLQSRSHHFRPPSSISSVPVPSLKNPLASKTQSSAALSPNHDLAQGSVALPRSPASLQRTHTEHHSNTRQRQYGDQASNDKVARQVKPLFYVFSLLMVFCRQPAIANDVEYARNDLLGISDWVGLATTRPARFNKGGRDDMKKFGRRRKVTSLKRKHAEPEAITSGLMQPIRRAARQMSSLRTEDISVRVGSNIHRTQTTPSMLGIQGSAKPREETSDGLMHPPAAPGRSGTSDTASNKSRHSKRRSPEPVLASQVVRTTTFESPNGASLVSLNEAVDLHLDSWDRVRTHSSYSRSQTNDSIAMLPSDPGFVLPSGSHGTGHGSSVSQNRNRLAESAFTRDHSQRQSSTVSTPSIIERGLAVGVLELEAGQSSGPARLRQGSYRLPSTPRLRMSENTQSVLSPQLPSPSVFVPTVTETSPRYTLEEQVDLEQRVEELEHIASNGANGGRRISGRHSPLPTRYSPVLSRQSHSGDDQKAHSTRKINRPALAPVPKPAADNEAWMKFVFPDEERENRNIFEIDATHLRNQRVTQRPAKSINSGLLSDQAGSSSLQVRSNCLRSESRRVESSQSVKTGANASLFIPVSQTHAPTETDFLSMFSPMEGCLDERAMNLSEYNNAAQTEHSFWGTSELEPQRSRPSPIAAADAYDRPRVPAKRPAQSFLEKDPATSRKRRTYEPVPPQQRPSLSGFGSSIKAMHGSLKIPAIRDRPLARSPPLFLLPQDLTTDPIWPSAQIRSTAGPRSLNSVAERTDSPVSIFIPSDGLAVESSVSSSSRLATPSTIGRTPMQGFHLRSGVSRDLIELQFPSPGYGSDSIISSSHAVSVRDDSKSTMVNIHTATPRNFTPRQTQISAHIPLWSES